MNISWLNNIKWDENGLLPVITQDVETGDVLMFAWMNREALLQTVKTGQAVYWSRSRKKLWLKGEESGHIQKTVDIRIDCDEDVLLLQVRQTGGIACHTGHRSCFYRQFQGDISNGQWVAVESALKDPKEIYK